MSTATNPSPGETQRTRGEEAVALQLLVHLLVHGDARHTKPVLEDFSGFHHLLPLAKALQRHGEAMARHNGWSMTTEIAKGVLAQAIHDSPASVQGLPPEVVNGLTDAPKDPAKASSIVSAIRTNRAQDLQREAFQRAMEVASRSDKSPLEDGLRTLRQEMGRITPTRKTDPRQLRDEKIKLDAMIDAGTAGFALNAPFFNVAAQNFLHGWIKARRIKPADKILFGGDSNAGKTSFANSFVASALSANIPVYYHQAELMLCDAQRQIQCALCGIDRNAPALATDKWDERLEKITYPEQGSSLESVNALVDGVRRWADEIRAIRASEIDPNPLTGVMVLDYCQLMDDENSAKESYQRAELIVSRLAQLAAETGVGMLLLSQTTRGSREKLQKVLDSDAKYGDRVNALFEYANSSYAGGNLMRPADTAFCIATEEYQGKHRRILTCGKSRGGEFGRDPTVANRCIQIEYDDFGRVRGMPYANAEYSRQSEFEPDPTMSAVADLGVQIIAQKNGKRK